ncbi:MAG: hypothetical protein NDI61_05130, partial [Bdellovibrionaceae bacterium]|nr:hypothetical protein [Pseudobdellovibrionaceae bacterium]
IHNFLIILALLYTLSPTSARAELEPTFGPEFEFTNDELENAYSVAVEESWAARMIQVIERKCAPLSCRVEWHRGKHRVREARFVFPDGFWFNVSVDPKVIEVQAKPQTLTELRRRSQFLEEMVFESAREVGLRPKPHRAGHFNIGLMSAFNGDPDEFLKFFLDYSTHAELASGILRENFRTAPPLAVMSTGQINALNRILEARRAGRLPTIKSVIERIVREVYFKNLATFAMEPPSHNQAINLDAAMVPDFPQTDKQLEIRAVRAQSSAHEFVLLAELFTARMRFLKTRPLPNQYDRPTIQDASWTEKVEAFRQYVAETGLDPERFMSLVPRSAPWPRHCVDLFD